MVTFRMAISKAFNLVYYHLKPLIPRSFQIWMRRILALQKRRTYVNVWPILEKASEQPKGWPRWPNQKRFALVLTHDVDTALGQERCHQLMEAEKQLGFSSSFNFVPERYNVSSSLRANLIQHGFEVGVHGLNHDGKLYSSKKVFQKRSTKINYYLRKWGSVGFRSPAMHHNLDWISDLEIEYDASTFDTDPFEPQPDGVDTIFPFWVKASLGSKGFVELPCTLAQDFILFILLRESNIDIWKSKVDWICSNGGMALLNTHPDYMNFNGEKLGLEEYPSHYYTDFLNYIKTKYEGQYWHALPNEVASFTANLVRDDS